MRLIWKIDPDHALQVSNAYPGVGFVFIMIRLNKLNVLGAKMNGSCVRLGLESTIAPDFPRIACDSFATVAYAAKNEGYGHQD